MNRPNFSQRLNDFPPILCRLLAREKSGPPLTTDEIAERTTQTPGIRCPLNPVQVETFSQCTNWSSIPILDALSFMYGCRVDLTDATEMRRINDYLMFAAGLKGRKKTMPFRYLRLDPHWKDYWLPMLIRWRKSYVEKIPNTVSLPIKKLLERLTPVLNPASYRNANRQKRWKIEPLPDDSLNDISSKNRH